MGEPVPFAVPGLVGWVRDADADRRVLLLHGGPAMSYRYLDGLLDVLPDWSIASFQQRGRDPSTTQGPFDVPTMLTDIAHVLEHLAGRGWHRPLVVGHSWGGHLAWHVAATLGSRVGGEDCTTGGIPLRVLPETAYNAADTDVAPTAQDAAPSDHRHVGPRSLASRERRALDALEDAGAERLRVQAATTQVYGGGVGGCPSISRFHGSYKLHEAGSESGRQRLCRPRRPVPLHC